MSLAWDSDYKAAKQAFWSDLEGGPLSEIWIIISILTLAMALSRTLAAAVTKILSQKLSKLLHSWGVLDFCSIVLPALTAQTRPDLHYSLIISLSIAIAITALISGSLSFSGTPEKLAALNAKRKPFLSAYRAVMMLSTAVAILAVDFPIFPRRFAKTERYGTSLMDVGVGSFLFSNALVARNRGSPKASLKERFLRSFGAAAPLLALGAIRTVSVKSIEYVEHVTEYGVHWNFFFTLGGVSLIATAVNLGPRASALFGAILTLSHQTALIWAGLADWIAHAPRTTLISMNKEGIASLPGYTVLWMFGTAMGAAVAARHSFQGWVKSFFVLVAANLIAVAALTALPLHVEPVSRQSANAAYIVFVLAFNIFGVAAFLALDLFLAPGATPLVDAINRNQLAVFLFANAATGAVNTFVPTIYTPDSIAWLILAAYLAAVCFFAITLDKANVTLKFW